MDERTVKFENFKKCIEDFPLLCKIEKLTKVPKEYVAGLAGAILTILLFFRIRASFICNLVGVIYPTYCSWKVIESKCTDDKKQWLVYWMCYASFRVVDSFIEFLLRWFLLYYFFKLGFFIWSTHPSTKGALLVYKTFLKQIEREQVFEAEKSYLREQLAKVEAEKEQAEKKLIKVLQATELGFSWQWLDENNAWIPYLLQHQLTLEMAFQGGTDEVQLISQESKQKYCINIKELTQTNVKSRTSKRVQRVLRNVNYEFFQYPAEWIDDNEQVSTYPVQKNTAEYAQVCQQFEASCPTTEYTITSISRIQNRDRFKEYQLFRSELKERLQNCTEMKLFHGTSEFGAQNIPRDGFDWRRCGVNGTAFGQGSYFAVNANYSARRQYSRPDADGVCNMFFASVTVGDYAQGSSNLKNPPDGFHSLVDNVRSPTIFVVTERKQAYPDYLITFKRS